MSLRNREAWQATVTIVQQRLPAWLAASVFKALIIGSVRLPWRFTWTTRGDAWAQPHGLTWATGGISSLQTLTFGDGFVSGLLSISVVGSSYRTLRMPSGCRLMSRWVSSGCCLRRWPCPAPPCPFHLSRIGAAASAVQPTASRWVVGFADAQRWWGAAMVISARVSIPASTNTFARTAGKRTSRPIHLSAKSSSTSNVCVEATPNGVPEIHGHGGGQGFQVFRCPGFLGFPKHSVVWGQRQASPLHQETVCQLKEQSAIPDYLWLAQLVFAVGWSITHELAFRLLIARAAWPRNNVQLTLLDYTACGTHRTLCEFASRLLAPGCFCQEESLLFEATDVLL